MTADDIIVLNENNPTIQYLCSKDKRLSKVVSMVGTITYKPHNDSYSFLISQIIGQMLRNSVADRIFARLQELCHGEITPAVISSLTDEQILSIGTARSKVNYIRSVTDVVQSGNLIFSELAEMTDDEVMRKLTSIRGIGNWSAKMYLIFALDRKDILPYEDTAFLQAYGWLYKTNDYSPEAVKKRCKKWKPYSSIAARYMYRALDMGLTKREFHLYK